MNQGIRYIAKKLVFFDCVFTLTFKVSVAHPTRESSANFMRLHPIPPYSIVKPLIQNGQ